MVKLFSTENKNVFLFCLIFSFLVYWNALKNGYSLDDSFVTVTNSVQPGKNFVPDNKLVAKGFSGIAEIWKSRFAHDGEGSFDYRPLVTTTFAIEYGIFGQSPFISHLINIILYVFCSYLTFLFILLILKDKPNQRLIAFLGMIIFIVLPVHSEVVDNIKSRDELLAYLLGIGAIYLTLKFSMDTKKYLLLISAFLCFILSLYAKLSAAQFIVLIPFSLLFFSKIDKKKLVLVFIGLVALYYFYDYTKKAFVLEKEIRVFYHFENPLYVQKVNFFVKANFALKTFGEYIKLMFFPYPLSFYYGSSMINLYEGFNIKSLFGIIFLIVAGYYYFKRRDIVFLYGILFFLICIGPITNILSPVAGIVAERLAFTASLGFSIAMSVLLCQELKFPKWNGIQTGWFFSKPFVYISPFIVISVFYIWNRNTDWNSKLSLFEHDCQHLQKSAKANSLLGNEYFEMLNSRSNSKKYSDQVLIQLCMRHFNLAVEADSSMFSACNNAGVVAYSFLNDVDLAQKYFSTAIKIRPIYPQAHENLGNCYKRKKNYLEAEKNYKISIAQNNKQYSAYVELIKLYLEDKKLEKAIYWSHKADSIFPNDYEITAQYANAYFLKNDLYNAFNKYELAFKIYPNKNLAQFLASKFISINDSSKYLFYSRQYNSLP